MKKKQFGLERLINGPLEEMAKKQATKKKPKKKPAKKVPFEGVDETCRELSSRFRILGR